MEPIRDKRIEIPQFSEILKTSKNPITDLSKKIHEAAITDKEISLSDYKVIKTVKRDLKREIQHEEADLNKVGNMFLSIFDRKVQQRTNDLRTKKAEYESLKTAYSELVTANPSLNEVNRISKVIKNLMPIANSMFNENYSNIDSSLKNEFEEVSKRYGLLQNFQAVMSSDNPQLKDQFLGSIVDGLEQIRMSRQLKNSHITFLHGTRSPAMAVMLATDRTMHPTGDLLSKHNIIPLTGELGQGILPGSGINNSNISGTSLSKLGVKTTVEYAKDFNPIKNNNSSEWKYFEESNINKKLKLAENELKNNPNLEGSWGDGIKFDFLKAEILIGRLKVMDPDFEKNSVKFVELLDKLEIKYTSENKEYMLPFINNWKIACQAPPFIEPTENLRSLIQNSFPVILGSTIIQPVVSPNVNDLDEHIVKGDIPLEQMSVAFTEPEYVAQLEELLMSNNMNIEVMTFDALRVLGGSRG